LLQLLLGRQGLTLARLHPLDLLEEDGLELVVVREGTGSVQLRHDETPPSRPKPTKFIRTLCCCVDTMSNVPLQLLTNQSNVRGAFDGRSGQRRLNAAREAGIVRSGNGEGRSTRVLRQAVWAVLALGLFSVGLA